MPHINDFKTREDLEELQFELKTIQEEIAELQGTSDLLDFYESFTSTRLTLISSEKLGYIYKCTCKGKYIEEYAVKVEKGRDGLFTIPKCFLPISIIDIDAVKDRYQPLNHNNLKQFLQYLQDACFAFENRKFQIQQLQESIGDTVDIFSSISYQYVKLDFKLQDREAKTTYTIEIGLHYRSEDIRPTDIQIEKTNLTDELLSYIERKLKAFKLHDLKVAYYLATMKKEGEEFYFLNNEKSRDSSDNEASPKKKSRQESYDSEMSSSSSDE